MRILLLSHKFSPDIGGIETISEILAEYFSKAGHQVRVLTWSTSYSQKTCSYSIIRRPTMVELVKQHFWADLVFENNPCIRLSWPTIFFNRPLIIALHTWIKRLNGSIGLVDRIKFTWLRRAKKVIACSEAIRKGTWTEAIVIENPYQEYIFKRLPEIEKTKEFVFLGRLVSDKGVDLAISAFRNLVQSHKDLCLDSPSLNLTIVGDGPEREKLHKSVIEHGLENKVFFTGALKGENLVNALNQHRFIVIPSVWEEPFGVVALEAMACGCIPIGANVGGLPDAIGKAGLTFPKGDVEELTKRMKEVLANTYLEENLRKQSTAHLNKHKSFHVSKFYLDVIEDIMSIRK